MKKNNSTIVFSAVQPSGKLTIGNYLGAIQNWIELQDHYQCLYCIADLHALTNQRNINICNNIFDSTLDTLSFYLASGLDPDKSIIFMQSNIYEHTQLNWILNCYTRVSELMRMTQFKNKIQNGIKDNNNGLLNYPLLMASDILLYGSNLVPVGLDQIQHLELSRKIANRFNKIYGSVFVIPESLIFPYGSKIMSLLEPYKKMSKSDKNEKNVIFLLDNIVDIIDKISQSVTDSDNPPSILYNFKKKPGISNLLSIFSLFANKDIKIIEKKFLNNTYSFFKKQLSEIVSNKLYILQKKYYMYRKDVCYLKEILQYGAEKASCIARRNLLKIYKILGLII